MIRFRQAARAAVVGLAAFLAFSASTATAQTVAGVWHGTLTTSAASSLRLLVHIDKSADGSLSGTMDSIDQSPGAIPLTTVTASGDALAFTLAKIGGAFDGKWDAAAGAWVGQWRQSGVSLPLTLTPGPLPTTPTIAGLDGLWDGVLALNSAKLHLVLHVTTLPSGTTASLDSTDQLAYGLSVASIHRDGDKVGFDMAGLHASFAGALSADGQSLVGQWTQGQPLPLTFTRRAAGAAAAMPSRPQTPVKPYPYREEEVAFDDAAAHVKLAGTLTLPQGKGPFPAVVLIAGSGPNTRDEPIMGHRPFLVLSDWLTRHGVAVLRYDKRGTGASTGDYAAATSLDFAHDAEAAAAWLRARPEVDPRRVGLIGHSEGGLIAPMVAADDPRVAFVVLMAGPGVDGLDILMEQGRLIAKAMGATDAQIADATALRKAMFEIVRSEKDPTAAAAKLKVTLAAYAKAHDLPQTGVDAQVGQVNTEWFRFFFSYDPAPALRKLRCPVLALIGSKDLQVPPDQNLPALRAALAGDPRAEVREMPGLNHLFQTADTGSVGEYMRLEETIAPAALQTMSDWILKQAAEASDR